MSTSKSRPIPAASSRGSQLLQPQGSDGSGTQELAAAVDDLLDQLQHKFDSVSTEIFGKLDDRARRHDEVETSLIVADDTSPVG
jgi:heat shock factor-binding protein 1